MDDGWALLSPIDHVIFSAGDAKAPPRFGLPQKMYDTC